MGKGRSSGGFMGSGILGVFGTTIRCDSKDDSLYCNIMKLFNLLIVFLVVCFIFYYIYNYVIIPYSKRRR